MNLHEVLEEMGKEHVKIKKGGYSDLFHFNLKKKTIKNGKTVLVEDGKIIPQTIKLKDGRTLELQDDFGFVKEDFYVGLESRFEKYYHSMPSKHEKFVRSNFMAKNVDKMTYKELTESALNNRGVARYELEYFMLVNAIMNNIPWNSENWFWQSERLPKLIIYSEWI